MPRGVGALPPPHATCSKNPPSTRKMRHRLSSFLCPGFLRPAPLRNMTGIIKPSTRFMPEPRKPVRGARAAFGPAVATLSVAAPALFVTEIAPREQVTAGLTTGETVQLSTTVDGLSPPEGSIVIVDFADAPGATEAGDSAVAERPKPGAVTTKLIAADVLRL